MAVVFGASTVARAHPVPGDAKQPAVEPGKQVPRYSTVVSARRPPVTASQRVIDARELSMEQAAASTAALAAISARVEALERRSRLNRLMGLNADQNA